MNETPATLGELLADVDALVGAWAGALAAGVAACWGSGAGAGAGAGAPADPAADVLAMSDSGLVAVTEALAALSKRVDALSARCAVGLARRSPADAGGDGLARRFGHSTAAGLIAAANGSRYADAARLVSVGEATEPRATFSGERLPPRYPHVARALAEGGLGVEAASAITSFLDRVSLRADAADLAWSESLLVERAGSLGLDGVTRLIKQLEARLDPEGVQPREAELRSHRSLRIWQDAAGMINLRGRFDPITGAPIKVAVESLVGAELHSARDARRGFGASSRAGGGAAAARNDHALAGAGAGAGAGGAANPHAGTAAGVAADTENTPTDAADGGATSDATAGETSATPTTSATAADESPGAVHDPVFAEQRTIEQMNADALADIARLATSAAGDTLPALRNASVVARIDLDDLMAGRGHAVIDGVDQPVSASAARELAASAGIIPMICGGDGEVLDLGRQKRLFTKAQRIALAERDGGCAHPGCHRPIVHTHAHHLRWWTQHDGPTDLANGVLLCAFHHHLLHDGGWKIEVRERRTWFIPPPHIDPEQRPRAGNRSPHLDLRRGSGADSRDGGRAGPCSEEARAAAQIGEGDSVIAA